MELNENAQIDTGQVRDVGSSGGGGGGLRGLPIPGGTGGGVVGLIVLALVVVGGLIGGNSLLGGDPDGTDGGGPVDCATGNADRFSDVRCRNALYVNSIQNYWQSALPQSKSVAYEKADTIFFDQAVNTGCGQADSGVGPFYCPEDNNVYIDVTFWDELSSRFGAKGEFAQPYVLAHEYGHHIQDLDGTEATVRRAMQRDPGNQNAYSVKLELQADCYAGVWTKHATQTTDASGQPLFTSITPQDITDALEAAAAVGDDAIQKKMGGRVDESKFTHGSSADRQKWFSAGYSSGNPQACNTFGS
jgi:predicted metalloprotease